jgi:hypothetical protein
MRTILIVRALAPLLLRHTNDGSALLMNVALVKYYFWRTFVRSARTLWLRRQTACIRSVLKRRRNIRRETKSNGNDTIIARFVRQPAIRNDPGLVAQPTSAV